MHSRPMSASAACGSPDCSGTRQDAIFYCFTNLLRGFCSFAGLSPCRDSSSSRLNRLTSANLAVRYLAAAARAYDLRHEASEQLIAVEYSLSRDSQFVELIFLSFLRHRCSRLVLVYCFTLIDLPVPAQEAATASDSL